MHAQSPQDPTPFLVFIETSGNQAYLYATNKLKENVGASELTRRAGEVWAYEAAGRQAARIILSTSGKALFIAPNKAAGECIVREVTERALREAPGLHVAGAVVPLEGAPSEALRQAHRRFDRNRDAMPSVRAPVLPWAEPCATSGLPAAGAKRLDDQETFFSAEALAKRERAPEWFTWLGRFFHQRARSGQSEDLFPIKDIDQMQARFEDSQWVGVIFADGNGLGQIFLSLPQHLERLQARYPNEDWDYFNTMTRFSAELQQATEDAFYHACRYILQLRPPVEKPRGKGAKRDAFYIPVIPLVLAGDDLTLMIEGEYALPFTERFLTAFEHHTEHSPTIAKVCEVALGAPRLSAGAGVALVKPHFPFHLAHELAEGLLRSAKQAKQQVFAAADPVYRQENRPYPVSSLDFHVLFDASYTDLDTIREQRLTVDGARLYGGPYVVTPADRLTGAGEDGRRWCEDHCLAHLIDRIAALQARDDDARLRLPSGQMHRLREAAARGRAAADGHLRTLRWLDRGCMDRLKENPPDQPDTLFLDRDEHQATRFVDALNGAGFWPQARSQADTPQADTPQAEAPQADMPQAAAKEESHD